MTTTVAFAAQPMGLPVPKPVTSLPAAAVRHGLQQAKDYCFLCWMVAITSCFLAVGVIGVFEGDGYVPLMLEGKMGDPAAGRTTLEAAMVDVQSEEISPETVVEEVDKLEVPTPVEVLEVPQEIPDIVPALVAEDVFTIPTPPQVEAALRPVEPKPEQPKPQPKTVAKPNVRRGPVASPARGPQGTATTASGGGGSGGMGTAGVGLSSANFKLPKPPYPSHLKSMGVSGSVRLLIYTNTSGRVESVSVVSSSGNSALDEYASSWTRRNGRGPAGVAGKILAPLTFKLR